MHRERSNHTDESWEGAHATYWNSIANKYDVLYNTYWSLAEDAQTAQLLSRVVSEGCKILDLACGTGKGYELCQSLVGNCQYTGIDVSPSMITQCKKKRPRLAVELGDMSDLLRFEAETFDLVISLYTSFSFTNRPQKTIAEINRVLKPGGGVFVSALNRWSLRRLLGGKTGRYEEYHTRNSVDDQASIPAWTYSRRYLRTAFLEAGFVHISVQGQSSLGGVIEFGALWKVNALLSKLMPGLGHTLNISAVKPKLSTDEPNVVP